MTHLPYNQWTSRPTPYPTQEALMAEVGKQVAYNKGNVRVTSTLAAEKNTWGLALVRDDGVGVGYYRDPTWRPNQPKREASQ